MLILASDRGNNNIYTKLQDVMRQYIHSNVNIEAYFYKADPTITEDYIINGDNIIIKTNETYPNLWKKFWLVLKVFEHRLDEFSFICRPNLSTFIILERYLKHLETLQSTKCCSGLIFYGGQPIPFPSGYLFTVTPDLAKEFIYNNVIKDNEGIDDRCVGIILKQLGIGINNHKKYIEVNNTSTQYENCMNMLEKREDIFMIRIRNLIDCDYKKYPFGIDSEKRLNEDLKIHYALLKKYYNIIMED